jgi:hypothetical protein
LFYKTGDSSLYIYTGTQWLKQAGAAGFVPYSGATQNVNLGQFGLTTKWLQFDTSSQAVADRRLQWSNDEGTLQFGMTNGSTITQRIGLEQFARVKNVSGSQINKGQAVYIYGASGDRASVKLADNRADSTSSKTLGVATEDIANNDVGLVGTFGVVSNLNLSAFTAGDILYLDSIPGGLTKTKPQAPYHLVFIGVVERANSGNGLLFVNPQNGYELEELHNVRITSPVRNNALLAYDSVRALWVDTTLNAIGGISGTGTTNYIPKFTGTSSIGNSVLYDNGGEILINTTSDAGNYKLQVNGDSYVAGSLAINTSGQTRTITTFYGAGSIGNNIFIGGGGLSSGTGGGASSLGSNNTALGVNALLSNTTGNQNTAIGVSALSLNTTGYNNSAIGQGALLSNTTGSFNSAIGVAALFSNTTGDANSAIGLNAIFSNTTGYENTAMGVGALQNNTTGYYNSAFGRNAGRYVTAGTNNTTSNNSVYLGYDTRASADGNTNEIVIGSGARGDGSNTIRLGNTSITAVATSGVITGASFIPTSSTVPTNGLYLPAANTLGFATNSGEKMRISSTGSVGIGTTSLTGYNLRILKSITGATTAYGISSEGQIESDVTSSARYFTTNATQAAGSTLTTLYHYNATQGTISGTITDQYGYFVQSNLTSATNNYGFYGNITAGLGRWNLYMAGTANNHMGGSLGIGTTSTTGYNLNVIKNLTGAVDAFGIQSAGQIQSDVTSSANYFQATASQASGFTISNIRYFTANQGTISGTVTNQYGFSVSSGLTGATNNYGFFGNLGAASGVWNLYMNGTANNYMAGSLGIGTTSLTGYNLRVEKNLTGSTTSTGIASFGQIQSDATANARYFSSQSSQAAGFTTTNIQHYHATQGTLSGTVTNQIAFNVASTLTGGVSNFAFKSDLDAGTNRWNLYMNGTANNYLAGSLGIGTTSVTGYGLRVLKSITGATTSLGIVSDGAIQADVTNTAAYFRSVASASATPFALTDLAHFQATTGSLGSASITSQYGFLVASSMTGASNNFAFYGNLAAATGRWNLYMNGTADNYLAGKLAIGTTSPSASALLDVSSTTQGFLPPRMTGAQAEAIATLAAGLMIYANNGNGTTITSTGWWGYDGTTWVKLN